MFTLKEVVPWGRSFDEYRRMFALTDDDLDRRILGCADGPAGFNAEATVRGGIVISCDPLYRFGIEEISERIDQTFATIIEQTTKNAAEFVWNEIVPDVEALGKIRMAAMQSFLADYELGKAAGRYVDAQLPILPFGDGSFDLALCSHFLFLYSEQLSEDFHVKAIRELCRVGREARIFPLLELGGRPSRHVEEVTQCLGQDGYDVQIEPVDYEFQRGGNQMMRVRR